MKKVISSYISLFTLLICYVLPSNAQQAFYIYRNDGCINTFITTEIDSMTYSRLDLDSVAHDEYVVHEVYTPDSIFRIPIELIDSVGFVTPETVYQPGVRVLEGEMRNYIISRNELTLVFQSLTPNSLLPHVGDKLVTTEADDVITNAFVGQVSEVNTTPAGIEVVCEPVDLTEVFETYYGIIRKTDEPASARRKSIADGFYSTNGTRTLSPGKLTLDLLNTHNTQITYSPDDELSFSLNNARAAISLTPSIDYNAYVIVNKAYGVNVSVTAIGNYTVEEILALSGSIQFGGDVPLFEKAIPIPEALIDVYFEFGIFNTMTGKFCVDQTWTQKYRHVFHWEWSSKGHQTLKNVNDFKPVSSTHNGKIALNGSWGAGAYGRVGIAFIATSSLDIAEIGLRVEGGLMAEGTYVPYKRDEEYAKKSTDLYNQIKDREVTSYFYYGLSGEAKLFKWSVSHEVPNFFNLPLNKRWPFATVRDVPLFSDTKLVKDISGTYYASANVVGTVHKTDVGFALINKNNNEDATYTYSINDYQGPQTVINASFIDKPTSNKYIVYPLVKYMDMELIAEPSAPKEPTVTTGKVTDIDYTSAETYGNVKGLEPDNNIDIGICYSTYNPVDAYGTHVSSGNKNDGDFNVKLSGLIDNTTYYYCAYAYNNGEYYYGKTSSFKTKKKEDPDPDPDPNPDPDPDPEPMAITGTHFGETTTSAVVECTYKNVPQGASCRVEYSSSGAYASSGFVTNGNGDGTRTVTISGLKPNTEYTYCAYIELADKSSVYGADSTFTTKSLPIPIAITGDCYDVTSSSATIECTYENIEEGAESWCLVTESGTNNQQVFEFGSFEGTKAKELSNLKPSTTYYYMAYVDYEGETYEAQNGRKSFTTLTPGAYVEKADEEKITTTSVQFDYGFSNVPQNANCYIAIQSENEENYYYYSVSETEKDTYEFSGLQPSTTYTYWAYVELDGLYWNSNSESFTTKAIPIPSVITGDASDITDKSANVECTFSNVPEGGVCGVEFTWNGGSTKQACGSSDGTKTISLGGLKPNTTYTYCAYVEANGTTYYGEDKTFTTDLPDISGTWTCVEHHVRANGSTYDTSYSLTLGSDGKVQYSESSEIYSSSWSFSRNGTVTASIMDLATQYANSGKEWRGTVDDIENPTKITGGTYRWNYNQIGYFQGDSVSFEMTR